MEVLDMFAHWEQIRVDLLTNIDDFEKDELDYVPFSNAWSVKEILLHIAHAEEGWIQYVIRGEYDRWPDDFNKEEYSSKSEIQAKLNEVHKRTNDVLSTLSLDDLNRVIEFPWNGKGKIGWIIWHVLEHEIHHRGELSLMLGLLGREGLDV